MLRLYSVDPDPAMIAKIVYFVHDPAERVAFSPESSNLMYGMY